MFSDISDSKKLLLCRHSEALPCKSGQADFDRNLSPEGIDQALQGKKWLLQHMSLYPAIVSSSAARTIETAKILASAFSTSNPQFFPVLYESPAAGILNFINCYPEPEAFLMLVGHNPGISIFTSRLSSTNISFGTGQMVLLDLKVEKWEEVSYGIAEIQKIFAPR